MEFLFVCFTIKEFMSPCVGGQVILVFSVTLHQNMVLSKERSFVVMTPVCVLSYLQRAHLITFTPTWSNLSLLLDRVHK